jgi:hypothetical protein
MRYNRIEGFSAGVEVSQILGGGYTLTGLGRFGTADRHVNGEIGLTRSNLAKNIRLAAYERLAVAGDWGHPLSFGSSLSSVLFGRDEGFYYRSRGVELGGETEQTSAVTWRLFTEQHSTASPHTSFSLGGSNDNPNITSRSGRYSGARLRLRHSHGDDPQGFRVFSDLRLEAARGDSAYGRGALDLTFTQGIRNLATAVTLSAGTSAGALPSQRQWYLGGTSTVRGQSPDTAITGNAFWLTRAEIGRLIQGVRPSLFADIGWTGDRTKIREIGRPLSGVGAGLSLLDGLLRVDVARGLYPRRQWRVDGYVEAVF